MRYVWVFLSSAGIVLQLLLITELIKGAFRQYPLITVYAVTLFLTTVVEAAAFYNSEIWRQTSTYYWVVDAIRQVLIFSIVISLTYRAMARHPSRAAVRKVLVGGAILFTLISLTFTRDPRFGFWMTSLGRNLGFCAVILNLILWAVLVRHRQSDRLLLTITGGLGIQMAGKAIGHSLRYVSPATSIVGDLVIVLSHLTCLYVWWQAFRALREPDVSSPA